MVKRHIKKRVKKLRNRYRLIIFNDTTFAEKFSYRLSLLNVYSLISIFIFICLLLGFAITFFTPLKNFIPGYDQNIRQQIITNNIKLDSLEIESKKKDIFIKRLKEIISGDDIVEIKNTTDNQTNNAPTRNTSKSKSTEDSLLRNYVEQEEKFNLSYNTSQDKFDLTSLYLYPPTKGLVIGQMDLQQKHYGIDIATKKNAEVTAVLDGTVVFSEWTLETGFVIQIQHSNNLVSFYKHNAELLKKSGDEVNAGDVIAFIGNSGELSTGPHLHFELWYNGSPINPEDYIVF